MIRNRQYGVLLFQYIALVLQHFVASSSASASASSTIIKNNNIGIMNVASCCNPVIIDNGVPPSSSSSSSSLRLLPFVQIMECSISESEAPYHLCDPENENDLLSFFTDSKNHDNEKPSSSTILETTHFENFEILLFQLPLENKSWKDDKQRNDQHHGEKEGSLLVQLQESETEEQLQLQASSVSDASAAETTSIKQNFHNDNNESNMQLCNNRQTFQNIQQLLNASFQNLQLLSSLNNHDDATTKIYFETLKGGRYIVALIDCHIHGRIAQVTGALDWPGNDSSSSSSNTTDNSDSSLGTDDDITKLDDDDDDVFKTAPEPKLAKFAILGTAAFLAVWAAISYYRRREFERWQEYRTHQLLQAQDEAFDVTFDEEDEGTSFDLELVESVGGTYHGGGGNNDP